MYTVSSGLGCLPHSAGDMKAVHLSDAVPWTDCIAIASTGLTHESSFDYPPNQWAIAAETGCGGR
ncbi:hypothetical protein NECAME_00791 [Necator americanus]|uniref:Uncharacterized protein n=1 Tax=Necator americanus TaxID=51031 RepID=W2SYJ0_NECAM|nr:hypothetical protein NECAME_00791 [Necator americanus]ETN73702.1 hypothetical protein NECAME_00791 [Necator americanus]